MNTNTKQDERNAATDASIWCAEKVEKARDGLERALGVMNGETGVYAAGDVLRAAKEELLAAEDAERAIYAKHLKGWRQEE